MSLIKDGWFIEKNDLWPGHSLSFQVEKILHEEKSKYQNILIIKTKSHGKALILDGIIQCTEFDEFAYQEMISFLPLAAHDDPRDVLIIGGGDGGVVREVTKDKRVKNIVMVEIDGEVIEASKIHLPTMSCGFSSPKLNLHVTDGFEFVRQHPGQFDVIITDSSDPIGPAENLFSEEYYKYLKRALKRGGIICSQADSAWCNLDFVVKNVKNATQHFKNVKYAVTSVSSYITGQIGFVIATNDDKKKLDEPGSFLKKEDFNELGLRYYNFDIHSSAFVLPNYIKDAL